VTRDGKFDDDEGPLKPAAVLRQNRIGVNERLPADRTVNGQQIDFTYEHDAPAATDVAYHDESAAPPSEAATIPPPDQQGVSKPLAIINNRQAPVNATGGGVATKAAGIGMPPTEAGETAAEASAAAADPATPKQDIVVRMPNQIKPRNAPPPPPKELGDYSLPTWEILADAEHGFAESQEKYVREKAAALEQALREFNIDAHVVEIDTGPVITMYEISLAAGIKVASITQLTNDIARALMATSVRIVAPVPGKSTVGIEVPNPHKEKVRLKELMALAPEATRKMHIPLFLGKDASGEPLVTDLAAMPHCLIAGTTGSGKSVCINSIIMSIMYTQRPDMVKLILIDPKVVEMAPFKDIPHLMCPVINDTGRATSVLEWACEKMDERYEVLAEAGVRNLAGYNKLSREELIERFKPSSPEEEAKIPKFLPYMIIIVDELADLMITSGKEVEAFIVRLAQKSRAVGIHLILATQRPQANVVTGLIKSNMPSRIAFRVNSRMDSRIVLDQNGADLLLGQGDMLFLPPGSSKPIRSQGTFIDDKEIRESVKLTRSQAEAQYEPELVQIKAKMNLDEMEKDELFDDAVRIVLETKRGSVSLLQRRLTIGYSRASRLIEMMAATGIVGDYKGSQAREANYTLEEWEAMKAQEAKDKEEGMTV
jgi:S-DNA-T family DNA segregation ATPase FtsK/SpoIIIE